MHRDEPKSQIHDAYRFEPFEVRIHSDMLLRDGERVRLQELPLRLLLILLEQPGTVVTNEELGRRLGGSGWYVELGSVRVAVTKLREALGDSANAPRFVRTIPGQGYKFIAPVTSIFLDRTISATEAETEIAAPAVEAKAESGVPASGESASASREGPSSALSPLRRPPELSPGLARGGVGSFRRIGIAVVAILAIAGVTAWVIHRQSVRPVATEHDVVVVGGFANRSKDRALDGTLSSAFRVKMQESPYLSLLTDRKFRELVPNPDSATLSDELNACRSLSGQVLLTGQVSDSARGQNVELTAWRCQTPRLLAREAADVRSEAEILPALNRAAERMRGRLGEPDASLQRFNVPVDQATTSSLAALRAFTQGEEKHQQGLEAEAIRDYRFAVDLDPQFALAYARLGTIYYNSSEYALSRESYQKAFDLRGRTTDRERLYITANYYLCDTGETERAIEAYELWRKSYPRDLAPINNLAIQYLLIGEPQKAVELAHAGMALAPNVNISYATWSQAFMQTGDYATLNTMCDGQFAKNESAVFHVNCFDGAFAQGDQARMARELTWAKGQPEENLLMDEDAIVELYRGHAAAGWHLFRAARESAEERNMQEAAAGSAVSMAGFQADLGLKDQARATAAVAVKDAAGSAWLMGFSALAMARAGDLQRARELAAEATRVAPDDEILNKSVLASTRAAIDLADHQPEKAVQDLEESRAFDCNNFMYLAPIYYRGLAYLANNQLSEAVDEFGRLIMHRTQFPSSPYLLLAELELGHALQLEGKTADAASTFARLDAIWKGADTDFAPLHKLHEYEHTVSAR